MPDPTGRTRDIATAALFAALLAASAWLTIPLGAVPVTFQVFVIVLAALVLRPAWAAAAVGTYLLVGAVGIPVFSGARGGLGVLVGPTGGYLFGFVAGAWLGSVVSVRLKGAVGRVAGAVVVLFLIYLLGWVQLMLVTGMGPGEAAVAGVLPFVPLDALKAFVAVSMAGSLELAGVSRRVDRAAVRPYG